MSRRIEFLTAFTVSFAIWGLFLLFVHMVAGARILWWTVPAGAAMIAVTTWLTLRGIHRND